MENLSFVGTAEGLMNYLEEEANTSKCCSAQIINSRCGHCKEGV